MEKFDDVRVLNEMFFNASTEDELQEQFKNIYRRILDENEYDASGHVVFLPLSRLNSRQERQECRDIISDVIESGFLPVDPT